MSETRFLAALDSPSGEPPLDLLPETQRAAYGDLLAACEAARRERPHAESLPRLEARIEAGALRAPVAVRGKRWVWLAAAAAAALLLFVYPWFGRQDSPHPLDDPEEQVTETPIERKEKDRHYARQPGIPRLAIRKVTRDLGDRLDRLQALAKTAVVVLSGEFDDGASVLAAYRIPYTVVERNKFADYDLKQARLVVLCCGRNPTDEQKKALLKKLRDFTNADGSILTTDWALSPYLTDLFPAQVKEVQPLTRQPDTTVAVAAAKGTSPLLAGVFGKESPVEWWLEEAGKFVRVEEGTTHALVESPALKKRFGASTVALSFAVPFARGIVVHSQAHLAQKPEFANTEGIAAMHRLFLNTLLETTK